MKDESSNNIECDANAIKSAINRDFKNELRNMKQQTQSNNNSINEDSGFNKVNYSYPNYESVSYKSKTQNIPNYSSKPIEGNSSRNDNKELEKTITEIVNKAIDSKSNADNNLNYQDHYSTNLFKLKSKYKDAGNEVEKQVFDFEVQQIKQQNITLKNDNIILREDINRLNEIGVSLENELSYTRKKNLDLLQENESLYRELEYKDNEVNKLNEAITRLNFYETPGIAYSLEQKYILESKIKEIEKESRRLIEEKGKLEVENKITQDRFQDLKHRFDELNNELNFTKIRNSEAISDLESKINQFKENYEVIRVENKVVKNTDDKLKLEITTVKLERDNYEEKYNKAKNSKEALAKKVAQLEFQVNSLHMEKEMILSDRKRQEDERRMKNEMKSQCIEQMRNHIHSYKTELMRSRSKNK